MLSVQAFHSITSPDGSRAGLGWGTLGMVTLGLLISNGLSFPPALDLILGYSSSCEALKGTRLDSRLHKMSLDEMR